MDIKASKSQCPGLHANDRTSSLPRLNPSIMANSKTRRHESAISASLQSLKASHVSEALASKIKTDATTPPARSTQSGTGTPTKVCAKFFESVWASPAAPHSHCTRDSSTEDESEEVIMKQLRGMSLTETAKKYSISGEAQKQQRSDSLDSKSIPELADNFNDASSDEFAKIFSGLYGSPANDLVNQQIQQSRAATAAAKSAKTKWQRLASISAPSQDLGLLGSPTAEKE